METGFVIGLFVGVFVVLSLIHTQYNKNKDLKIKHKKLESELKKWKEKLKNKDYKK